MIRKIICYDEYIQIKYLFVKIKIHYERLSKVSFDTYDKKSKYLNLHYKHTRPASIINVTLLNQDDLKNFIKLLNDKGIYEEDLFKSDNKFIALFLQIFK